MRADALAVDGVAHAPSRAYPYPYPVWGAHPGGDALSFVIVDGDRAHRFEGRVAGDTVDGAVRSGEGRARTETRFRATRVAAPG